MRAGQTPRTSSRPRRTSGRRLVVISRAICLLTALLLATACGGGGGGGSGTPPQTSAPSSLSYLVDPGFYRVAEAISANTVTFGGGAPTLWAIAPALPTGLTFSSSDGAITGTPSVEAASAPYTITASNTAGQAQTTISLTVGAQLPSVFQSLAEGFQAEVILEPGAPSPAKIAKFAIAPTGDDRIFYIEVNTGNVRIIDPVTGLLPTPFVTLNVLQGGHTGLLGLTLAPDFPSSGHVYVLMCTPADALAMPPTVDRMRVLRYTEAANLGTNETIVIDNLPISPPMGVNNGGEILFDNTGLLFVSIGDTQNMSNSQAPAATSLAGKVLRYDVSSTPATVPAGNPFSGSPEWCRGLRNTFGLAVHPSTGGLFGLDNGPAANDELNYLAAGKNFEWGGSPPPASVGYKIKNWQTVIVPTALCWHDGTTWGSGYANDIFLCAYDDHMIHRFQMSGGSFLDVDDESPFAEFKLAGDDNHPLDIAMAPDGSLYISTFSGIYRIFR